MKFYSITTQDIKQHLINLPQVTFEITDACSLKCKYCCYGELYEEYDNQIAQNISYSKVKQLLDTLFNLWNENNKIILKKQPFFSVFIHTSIQDCFPTSNTQRLKKNIKRVLINNLLIRKTS